MRLKIPELSLVVLIGPSGIGKSTFAATHFRPTEVVSSDRCRGMVCDDENSLDVNEEAFSLVREIARRRLALGRFTVVDATNVRAEDRAPLLAVAREFHAVPVAIAFDLPRRIAQERNKSRPDRAFGEHVVAKQMAAMQRGLRGLGREGFRYVYTLKTPEDVEGCGIVREPTWTDRRAEAGPFDIIGDVHGCIEELLALLRLLGYAVEERATEAPPRRFRVEPPAGRRALFLGDLGDRGPDSPAVFALVMDMVAAGTAFCVPGNHDAKLLKHLRGQNVTASHGLQSTIDALAACPPPFHRDLREFLDGLVSHYVLDAGRLVVAHAGMKREYQGRASSEVRQFAMYGETTGETDEFGLPVRMLWAADYRGAALVVYGHTPTLEPLWLNNTVNIDTGCVFGGRLTALRFPERETLSVPAERTYYETPKPFLGSGAAAVTPQQEYDSLLDAEDVTGKRVIMPRLGHPVTIREGEAAAAFEVLSRFAVDPRWIVYLPPTMSPCETSAQEGWLERPEECFRHYAAQGVRRVVMEEKHMGSRAVLVVCRDLDGARAGFGAPGGRLGSIQTRTGRAFFKDADAEEALLAILRAALERAGFWEEFATGWAVFDAELMPWSAKAFELIRQQYAAVSASAGLTLPAALEALSAEGAAGLGGVAEARARTAARAGAVGRFADAYRRYCWSVASPQDYRVAPFHLLATQGAAHTDKDHLWHMALAERLAREGGSPVLVATRHRALDPAEEGEAAAACAWWEELTASGGEGAVVKPLEFVASGPRGLLQPALKCRGREYLRIIYGPEYDAPENLARLRNRSLGRKRALALREFALGVEGLHRFIERAPLRRVHECVFGVLALESEPVDPRL
ncbi:MAG: polynucleotide kinase-phosphatase [Candidatus Sumerlaeia bacterium]|nr:polynucleotide kinase-phosphatase [Candidatus Sumerlaeia bacterium]